MKLSVMNPADGKAKSELEISEKTFGVEFNEALVPARPLLRYATTT